MINIVSVGKGNVRSLVNWVRCETDQVALLEKPEDYDGGAIILPGVCSSKELMDAIRERGFCPLIRKAAASDAKIIGICAGFQVMGESTTEGGGTNCLSLLPLNTVRMESEQHPVSVNGWDTTIINVKAITNSRISQDFPRHKRLVGEAYFNHQFGVVLKDPLSKADTCGWRGQYLTHWVSSNLYGFQFHPEKSGKFGKLLLRVLR